MFIIVIAATGNHQNDSVFFGVHLPAPTGSHGSIPRGRPRDEGPSRNTTWTLRCAGGRHKKRSKNRWKTTENHGKPRKIMENHGKSPCFQDFRYLITIYLQVSDKVIPVLGKNI